jgi:hypothetical protein
MNFFLFYWYLFCVAMLMTMASFVTELLGQHQFPKGVLAQTEETSGRWLPRKRCQRGAKHSAVDGLRSHGNGRWQHHLPAQSSRGLQTRVGVEPGCAYLYTVFFYLSAAPYKLMLLLCVQNQ